jgi:hypothetical protein
MLMREAGPACGAQPCKTHGPIHHGEQTHRCTACGRQFGPLAPQRLVPAEARPRVEGWLGENIARHGSCRVVGVSRRWLMDLVSAGFLALPEHLDIPPARPPPAVRPQRPDGEADERCSVVEKKAHKPWRWLALATPTR